MLEQRRQVLTLAELEAQLPHQLFQEHPPPLHVFRPLPLLEPLPYLLPRVRSVDEAQVGVQPVPAWPAVRLGREDLDDVTVVELVVQRHHPPIHLGTDAVVSKVSVNPVGEIKRGRPFGQVLDLPLGRIDEDLITKHVRSDRLQELLSTVQLPVPVNQLAQPADACLDTGIGLVPFLVAPMDGDAVLGDVVHVMGAYLDFERGGTVTHHRGVKGLVSVRFGIGYVVVELVG